MHKKLFFILLLSLVQILHPAERQATTAKEIVTRWQPCTVLEGHADRVDTIAFKPDNSNILACGTLDETIRVWNLNDPGKQPTVLTGHIDAIYTIAFKPDNSNILASGSRDRTIRLWNISNPEEQPIIITGHTSAVDTIAFKPNNSNILASGSWDKTIRLWNLNNPEEQPIIITGHNRAIMTLAFKPDNSNILASGSTDGTIRLWDISNLDNWSPASYTLKEYFEQPLKKEIIKEKNHAAWLLVGLDHLRKQHQDDSKYQVALKRKIAPETVISALSTMPENIRAAFIEKYKLDTLGQ